MKTADGTGLSLLPEPVESVGVGHVSSSPSVATGGGNSGAMDTSWTNLSRNIQVLSAPPPCSFWLLAFVDGNAKPSVLTSGYGFSYQAAIRYFTQRVGNATTYFRFTNNRGTYYYVYEVVNGQRVIKLCSHGLHLMPTPNARAPWTLSATPSQGVGQVFHEESAAYLAGNVGVSFIARSIQGTWAEAATSDPSGNLTATPFGPASSAPDLMNALGQVIGTLISQLSTGTLLQGATATSRGYLYFGLFDPNAGAAQTPGEPDGTAIMRIHETGLGGASTYQIGMCLSEAVIAPALPTTPAPSPTLNPPPAPTPIRHPSLAPTTSPTATPTAQVVDIKVTTPTPPYTGPWNNSPTGVPTGDPPTNGLWWWQLAWIYEGSQPPLGMMPPSAVPNEHGLYGDWVLTHANHWLWYPAGGGANLAPGTAFGVLVGGDGNTYPVYSSVTDALNSTPIQPPSGSPPWLGPSASGQWLNPHPSYWIWIGAAPATATGIVATSGFTALDALLLVGGIVVVGGIAYYVLS
jgi:hypothetical protein